MAIDGLSLTYEMRSGNDADILHVRQLIGRVFGPLAGLSFF